MSRFVFYLMVILMIVWTTAVLADLAGGLLATEAVAAALANGSMAQAGEAALSALWSDFWGPTAQARAIVWGIPMLVFSMIAAIAQR